MSECKDNVDVTIDVLWYSSLFLMVYGFILWLFCIGVIVFGVFVYCLYRSWSKEDDRELDTHSEVFNRIPIVGDLNEYRERTKIDRSQDATDLDEKLLSKLSAD